MHAQNRTGTGTDGSDPEQGGTKLQTIAEQFKGALERYFRKRVRDRQEAADLVHEVFCRLAARADDLRIKNPEAYIFPTAANLLRDCAQRDISRREAKEQIKLQQPDRFKEISQNLVLLGTQRLYAWPAPQ